METELEGKGYQAIKVERQADDWIHCSIQEGKFKIRCGPQNLEEALAIFLSWCTS